MLTAMAIRARALFQWVYWYLETVEDSNSG